MPKPTEAQKLAKKTTHKHMGKLRIKGQELDMEITTETTPNAGGGYDTLVKLPDALPMQGEAHQPGG